MSGLEDGLRSGFGALAGVLAPDAVLGAAEAGLLLRYLQLLSDWTTRVDLVAPAAPEILLERHVLDSLAAWLILRGKLNVSRETPLLDIGSGAGLPGLILAVLDAGRPVFLCEPREKRALFLRETVRELELKNVTVLNRPLEELAAADCPGLGVAIARAVGKELEIVPAALKLLPAEGRMFLMAGASWFPHPELPPKQQIEYKLPRDTRSRKIVGFWA